MTQSTQVNQLKNGWKRQPVKPSKSPALNPIKILWHDLKKAVQPRQPKNLDEQNILYGGMIQNVPVL